MDTPQYSCDTQRLTPSQQQGKVVSPRNFLQADLITTAAYRQGRLLPNTAQQGPTAGLIMVLA